MKGDREKILKAKGNNIGIVLQDIKGRRIGQKDWKKEHRDKNVCTEEYNRME